MCLPVAAWNPGDPRSWGAYLGLVPVDLLPSERRSEWRAQATVLLNGRESSFAACVAADRDSLHSDSVMSWCWSANLRHAVLLDEHRGEMVLRRWDDPRAFRRFPLPHSSAVAERLLGVIDREPAPRDADVLLYVLRAFRRVRELLQSFDAVTSIHVLNALLVGTHAAGRGLMERDQWHASRTIGEALAALEHSREAIGVEWEVPNGARHTPVGILLDYLARPAGRGEDLRLQPDLLLRHAAGELYQEAHLLLEREPQISLPGMGSDGEPRGELARDVRFTPTALARALVQQAFEARGNDWLSQDGVDILDPACGSGVFLLEALRELVSRCYRGEVRLRGFDTSPISCAIARFCLQWAANDAHEEGLQVNVAIQQKDALAVDWGAPDAIVMNPPFVPWQRMSDAVRQKVREVLGEVGRGRPDEAMAFITRGTQSLGPGGALGSVVPSALMETEAGVAWRERITEQADLWLLGRFRGYGYFRASMVEPGFVVLRARGVVPGARPSVRLVVAKEGGESRALRALRGGEVTQAGEAEDWELAHVAPAFVTSASWLPRPRSHVEVIGRLRDAGTPRVSDLFRVHQGARTGWKRAFMLSRAELAALPEGEKQYFRRAITTGAIRDGSIVPDAYVFYPYGDSGLLVADEQELQNAVPEYYARSLKPAEDTLRARRSVARGQWWALSRPRTWQWRREPRMVSTYFGRAGSFGYDDRGEVVVVQGHAWIWAGGTGRGAPSALGTPGFHKSLLPWAYLALLNSRVFEIILECLCPRVQGGQFNLSRRFVSQAYIPDLQDPYVTADSVEALAELGHRMHRGEPPDPGSLAGAAARAYRIPALGDRVDDRL